MTTFRRLNLFSWLLAVLITVGGAMPPLAVWQCRHASRVVSAAVPLSAMPCPMADAWMGGIPMPHMACCPPEIAASPTVSPHSSAITRPACHPTLTRLAVLTPASVSETHSRLQCPIAAASALPQTALLLSFVPLTLPLRQRPPPSLGFCQSALKHAPGLRAPPAA